MKLKEVLHSYHAINILCEKDITISVAMKLSKVQTSLKTEFNEFQNVRNARLKKVGLDKRVNIKTGAFVGLKEDTPDDLQEYFRLYEVFNCKTDELLEEESNYIGPGVVIRCSELINDENKAIAIKPAILTQLAWLIIE